MKRLKGSPVAHQIPFDILCSIAQAGGPRLAVDLATTCRAIKRRIDERYEVSKIVDFEAISNFFGRLPCAVGKYTSVRISRNCSLRRVPKSVQNLVLQEDFILDDPADLLFLQGVTELSMECCYWGSLSRMIFPDSIQSLTIAGDTGRLEWFRDTIAGIKLPANLTSLTFGSDFDGSVDGLQLPNSLESLVFKTVSEPLDNLKLPNTLKTLHLSFFRLNLSIERIKLPKSLRELYLGSYFNSSLESMKIPDNLQVLRLGNQFNQSMGQLPRGLRALHIGERFNQYLKLPEHLEVLEILSGSFDVICDIPKSLKTIYCHHRNHRLHERLHTIGFFSRYDTHMNCCFKRS